MLLDMSRKCLKETCLFRVLTAHRGKQMPSCMWFLTETLYFPNKWPYLQLKHHVHACFTDEFHFYRFSVGGNPFVFNPDFDFQWSTYWYITVIVHIHVCIFPYVLSPLNNCTYTGFLHSPCLCPFPCRIQNCR